MTMREKLLLTVAPSSGHMGFPVHDKILAGWKMLWVSRKQHLRWLSAKLDILSVKPEFHTSTSASKKRPLASICSYKTSEQSETCPKHI